MKQHPELFATYNATYTNEREQLLKTIAVNHYLSDFGYSVKLKNAIPSSGFGIQVIALNQYIP
ncbi:MAG: hypothetical protein U0T77_11355 [Chitinophagales bacterium]